MPKTGITSTGLSAKVVSEAKLYFIQRKKANKLAAPDLVNVYEGWPLKYVVHS